MAQNFDIFQSQYSSAQMENSYTNGVPRINPTNKHWERWDISTQTWVDTGVIAEAQTTGASWGQITGTLANQSDLNTALQGKASTTYVDAELLKKAPLWDSATTYSAGAFCIHNGYLWKNTSGASSTNVEPSTNYNVWNVTYSNTNLLDNPWFTVNQRGFVSRDSGANLEYTADRWATNRSTLNLSSNGISIAWDGVNGENGWIGQYLEFERFIYNQLYTTSLIIDGSIYSTTFTISNPMASYSYTPIDGLEFKFYIGMDNDRFEYIIFSTTTTPHIIKAGKLELGFVSTLSNDTAPNKAEELVKCMGSKAHSTDTYSYGCGLGGLRYTEVTY